MGTKKQPFLIVDANILIDYFKCDRTIIKLLCTYVGQVHLATPVLSEVKEIRESDCLDVGIILVEPDIEHVMLATTERRGPLSFQDHLCLILAREHGWTCVTNDKPLRRECEGEGVPLIWGVELICDLVEAGGLPSTDAKDIILCIRENNPKYITENIVRAAFTRLGIGNTDDEPM
jgi:rRNA-processing protein FCF1